MAKLRLNLL